MHPKNAPGGEPEPASLGPEPKGHWIYPSRTNYAPIQIHMEISDIIAKAAVVDVTSANVHVAPLIEGAFT